MKKIFFFLAFAAMSVSCSGDNDSNGKSGKITMNVNGVDKTFGNVERTVIDVFDTSKHVEYTATNLADHNQYIVIEAYQGDDLEGLTEFRYYEGYDENYVAWSTQYPFTSSITKHTDHQFQATFAGTLRGPSNAVITNGKINIKY